MSTTTYHRRKAAGLCPHCGIVPPQEGFVLCGHCRFTEARRQQPTLTPALWRFHEALRQHTRAWWIVEADSVTCGACGMTYAKEG